jgi:hypothetical protein
MNSDLFKRFVIGLIFSIFAVIFLQNTFTAEKTFAQADSTPWASRKQHTGEPFGGLVTFKLKCDCPQEKPGNYAVILIDYVSKQAIWLKKDEKSKMYEHWVLEVNRYGLGTYDKGGMCYSKIFDPQCRKPLKMHGTLNRGPGTGTSL